MLIRFVGTVHVDMQNLKSMPLPANRPSQIESASFSGVVFCGIHNLNELQDASYTKLPESLFLWCCSSLKDLSDFQMSSNSIYRAECTCPTSDADEHYFCHLPFLASKNSSVTKFILMERKCYYLKQNEYCDIGEPLITFLSLDYFRYHLTILISKPI